MGYLQEAELGPSYPPFIAFREHFGFVPNLFRAQSLLPRAIEAEAGIAASVLLKDQALSRIQKERILLALSAAHRNTYCLTLHSQMLSLLGHRQTDLPVRETALLDFAVKLGTHGPLVSREDIAVLTAQGWTDEAILEAILTAGLANFLCTLATGLGAKPDFEPLPIPPHETPGYRASGASPGPYLRALERSPGDFAPFAFFLEKFGFVPNIFKAQTLRPDVIEAEAGVIRAVLLTEDLLTRVQKESILLVVSAANLNTYCVAVHCEMLRALGVSADDSDQIAVDHRQAQIPEGDKALLDFIRKLAVQPAEFRGEDMDRLRDCGFSQEQILEAVVMTSLTNFLNTLQMGLGVTPDFKPRRVFPAENKLHLSVQEPRLTDEDSHADPDAGCVARVQNGDLDAFEDLINRHGQRVYRTLIGILGDADEARDAMQDTFLKAFQHLGGFQGRSKFSTWLVSIASNTGVQRLRERKNLESLDEDGDAGGFRPRQVQAWTDNPEQVYSKTEIRKLVENGVRMLPAKYRMVVVLRDIQQLSTEETAAALGLGIPALKARLIRGRLMLRETLAPHFAAGAAGVTS